MLINLKEGDFSKWLWDALQSAGSKQAQQYYPDRTLVTANDKQHSINLSLNTIADVNDQQSSVWGISGHGRY